MYLEDIIDLLDVIILTETSIHNRENELYNLPNFDSIFINNDPKKEGEFWFSTI